MWVVGPGGQGKSRLAARVATILHNEGWMVAEATSSRPYSSVKSSASVESTDSFLVIVDYADRWPRHKLSEMIEELILDQEFQKLRVLMLARPGPGKWESLAPRLERIGIDLRTPFNLGPLADTPAERESVFREASAEFGRRLGVLDSPPAPPHFNARGYFGVTDKPVPVLSIHMSALASVCALLEGVDTPELSEVSSFLLGHERRYWPQEEMYGELLPGLFPGVVMVSTMFGPFSDENEALALIRRTGLAGDTRVAQDLLNAHRTRYHDTHRPGAELLPLPPDRLGEDFVGSFLSSEPRARSWIRRVISETMSESLGKGIKDPARLRQALIVLAASSPRYSITQTLLVELFEEHPKLTQVSTGEVIQLVADYGSDDLKKRVYEYLPRQGAEMGEGFVNFVRHMYESQGPKDGDLGAGYLNDLAVMLSDLGRPTEALRTAEKAVELYGSLSGDVRRSNLIDGAIALVNLSQYQSDAGLAEEAVQSSKGAVRDWEEFIQYEPWGWQTEGLAHALSNLSERLLEASTTEDPVVPAIQAVEVCRSLMKTSWAGPVAYGMDMAHSLGVAAKALSKIGRTEEALAPARDAVELCRALIEPSPETYRAVLANCLDELSVRQYEAGHLGDSIGSLVESVGLYRKLSNEAPISYRPRLASSLIALSHLQAEAESLDSAISSAREAVDLYQALASRLPTAYQMALDAAEVRLDELSRDS